MTFSQSRTESEKYERESSFFNSAKLQDKRDTEPSNKSAARREACGLGDELGSSMMLSSNNQFRDGPSRNVDTAKQESELGTNIKKATSAEETAPKRKHVRACIVYTW